MVERDLAKVKIRVRFPVPALDRDTRPKHTRSCWCVLLSTQSGAKYVSVHNSECDVLRKPAVIASSAK